MTLTPDQKQAVSNWVAAGDSLSQIQKKLAEQFQISMTYMDVRFLVDDLNLALKDRAPKVDASDVSKTPPPRTNAPTPVKPEEKKGFLGRAKEKLGLGKTEGEVAPETSAGGYSDDPENPDAEFAEDENLDGGDFGQTGGSVSVAVDKVTLLPGAVASGTVTFSDGVTGKWIVDNYGRPGFTEVSQPGYRPSPADAQAFMQELNLALQRRGF